MAPSQGSGEQKKEAPIRVRGCFELLDRYPKHLNMSELYDLRSIPILSQMAADWQTDAEAEAVCDFVDAISDPDLIDYKEGQKRSKQIIDKLKKAFRSIPGGDTFDKLKTISAILPITLFRLDKQNQQPLTELSALRTEFAAYVKAVIAQPGDYPDLKVAEDLKGMMNRCYPQEVRAFCHSINEKLKELEQATRNILRDLGTLEVSLFDGTFTTRGQSLIKTLRQRGALRDRTAEGQIGRVNLGAALKAAGAQDVDHEAPVRKSDIETELDIYNATLALIIEARTNFKEFRGPATELDLFRFGNKREVFRSERPLFDNELTLIGLFGTNEAQALRTTLEFDKIEEQTRVMALIEQAIDKIKIPGGKENLVKSFYEKSKDIKKPKVNHNGMVNWELDITEAVSERFRGLVSENDHYVIRIQTPNYQSDPDPNQLIVMVEHYPTKEKNVRSRRLLVFEKEGRLPDLTLKQPKGMAFLDWFRSVDEIDRPRTRIRIPAANP